MCCWQASRRPSRRTRCAIRSQRTCSRAAPTCARCRRCSATPTSARRRSTRMWTASTCGRCTGSIIRAGRAVCRERGTPLATKFPTMILVIDNYDSFTYNLVQYLGALGETLRVERNDAIAVDDIAAMALSAIVLSPGPGTPGGAGITVPVIRRYGPHVPILGVCLGHQAIGEAYGGRVIRAPRGVMHGKTSKIRHDGRELFAGVPSPLEVMRYHSLVVESGSLPSGLEVTATAVDDPT